MKRVRNVLFSLVAVTFIVFFPPAVRAQIMLENLDSLRCGDQLVELGQTQLEVVHLCGAPEISDTYYVVNGSLDRWTYNMGPEDFIYVFTFMNGQLR
ncbi:MAG: DUF2845 domain-containing protein, partial [Syntrophobacteraceae bacterium]